MYRLLKVFYSIIILNVCFSCNKKIIKNIVVLNTERFFGYKKTIPDGSLINHVSLDMNKAFGLESIERSAHIDETRIYFTSPFKERLFLEKQSKDSTIADIFNCKIINRRDSLFMKIGNHIKLNYKFYFNQEVNTDSIPVLLDYIKDTSTNVADGGISYFYEIKKGSLIKKGIIDMNNKTEKVIKGSI